MTVDEAIAAASFWTTNLAETVALGASTDPEVAHAFNCTVSVPMQAHTDPQGPRAHDIRVSRWLTARDENDELVKTENPVYIEIASEIERRKAVAA